MASVVTINRPDVVALIEKAAKELTEGNKTELVATAVRHLLDEVSRTQPLFGAHPGSVKVRRGIDLTRPVIDLETDAESGREVRR